MHIQDWLPTILSAVGGQSQDLGPIDGIDMWDILNNDLETPRKQLLHNIDDIWKVWALREGHYKLISGTTKNGHFDRWYLPPGGLNAIRNHINYENCEVFRVLNEKNYSIKTVKPIPTDCGHIMKTECNPKETPCLFDLRSDPCEHNNIFKERPDIVKRMLNLLSEFNSTAVKVLNRGSDQRANPKYHNNFWSSWKSI